MLRWLTELKLLLEFERVIARDRHSPADIASINAAAEEATRRFPDSEFRQQTKAQSELMLRRLRGLPVHDA